VLAIVELFTRSCLLLFPPFATALRALFPPFPFATYKANVRDFFRATPVTFLIAHLFFSALFNIFFRSIPPTRGSHETTGVHFRKVLTSSPLFSPYITPPCTPFFPSSRPPSETYFTIPHKPLIPGQSSFLSPPTPPCAPSVEYTIHRAPPPPPRPCRIDLPGDLRRSITGSPLLPVPPPSGDERKRLPPLDP